MPRGELIHMLPARPAMVAAALVGLALLPGASNAQEVPVCAMHQPHAGPHERASCGMTKLGEVEVSQEMGLGQIEVRGTLGAVVEREGGRVALLDLSDPANPAVLGRYDGNTGREEFDDPFDGDLAFSHDGRFLFYARQTHQYSNEGLHALDISDPADPSLAAYSPQGGMLRLAYHRAGSEEYIVTLDAIAGLTVFRFDRTAGGAALVPVYLDPLPALKVGGPASAGLFIDPEDEKLGVPLLYVTTGRTSLQVFDFSTPSRPVLLGSWNGGGLADIEVHASAGHRLVYAATEYWFTPSTVPRIVVLDATDLAAITETARFSPGDPAYPAGVNWRVQGIELADGRLYVAHSHAGLGVLDSCCLQDPPVATTTDLGTGNTGGEFRTISSYAMDVELLEGGELLVSDASTGSLSVFRLDPEPPTS